MFFSVYQSQKIQKDIKTFMIMGSDDEVNDFFRMSDSDESSALADEIQTISPGDIIEHYDERVVRGRPDANKQTMVLNIQSTTNDRLYLKDYYPIKRDSEVKIISKLQENGERVPFQHGTLMKMKKYHTKETVFVFNSTRRTMREIHEVAWIKTSNEINDKASRTRKKDVV